MKEPPSVPNNVTGAAYEAMNDIACRMTEEIGDCDVAVMTGPTSIMHFCGLPSVTLAGPVKTDAGVNQALILYGKDEYRLYEAALAIEQVMMRM